MNKVLAATIICLSLSSAIVLEASQKGYYRWTDENGVVKSADTPPEGIESEFIKFTTRKSSKNSETDTEKQAEIEKNATVYDKMEVLPEKDPALCKQAQGNIKALEGARIRITEDDGSKRILTEDEKETQRENARKFIKIHC